jgi:hypothetical protein
MIRMTRCTTIIVTLKLSSVAIEALMEKTAEGSWQGCFALGGAW